MMTTRLSVMVMSAAMAAGCTADATTTDAELVDNAAWELDTATEHDTHPEHRPAVMEDCNPFTVIFEEGVLELDTRLCPYFVVSQTTLADIQEGDTLELEWSHLDLDAPEPSSGHLALALDDELQWETEVAIPSEPNAYAPTWTAGRDFPAATRVTFHLHNHGINNWRLHGIRRTGE